MSQDEIVGHKTFFENGRFRHEPLLKSEADGIMERVEKARVEREKAMPDEQSAIDTLFQAWLRLTEFGWKEAIYCPKDGTNFQAIEAGSTGIHNCHYQGEWPDGAWWVSDDSGVWPSHPTMFKLYPTEEQER